MNPTAVRKPYFFANRRPSLEVVPISDPFDDHSREIPAWGIAVIILILALVIPVSLFLISILAAT